jgi:bacillaene synthase trans-acting acyltransferase
MKKKIFLFSGQGSHYFHMGKTLYENEPVFRSYLNTADDLCKQNLNFSIIEILYDPKNKKSDSFSRTLYTHPAIFIIEYSLGMLLISKNILPDLVLGASLGEFAAAVISGMISIESALFCVVEQAKLFEKLVSSGTMLAILSNLEFYYDTTIIREKSELSAVNFNSSFVISTLSDNIHEIKKCLKSEKVPFQILEVSHPFHSSWIDNVYNDYMKLINQLSFHQASIPLVSCADSSKKFKELNKNHFWYVIRDAIQFQETIIKLEKEECYEYIDVGPSGTLANFVKYNLTENSLSEVNTILTPMGNDLRNLEVLIKKYNNAS